MTRAIMVGTMTALLLATAVRAEPVVYTWTGMGVNVPGSSKCATYKMTVDVTVDAGAVKGTFQQQGREERSFEGILDDKGRFMTKATLGALGGSMDVGGTFGANDSTVVLSGYCKFGGHLTKK